MGILNAIFAPFIVLYLLMYSFFRYFDVGRSLLPCLPAELIYSTAYTGISQEPKLYRWPAIHPPRPMEIPRVQ
jgi:hypothetical protein